MNRRLEFSRKTKRIIIDRAAGRCEACKAMLKAGEGEVDHILPCELGGEPTVANGRLLCRVCHREKTNADVRRIRKSDRQRDKSTGAIRTVPVKKLSGPGFPKTEKALRRQPKQQLAPRALYQPVEDRK